VNKNLPQSANAGRKQGSKPERWRNYLPPDAEMRVNRAEV